MSCSVISWIYFEGKSRHNFSNFEDFPSTVRTSVNHRFDIL